ncbi:DivIVA domain-containing protein [Streptomyces sp. ME19-01-6]|uniref:DivIVA domain-containing protein n=1 Tax=Streptomyces sp. ME19-01-6 TaxID=3028686 RepID=UPI0029B25CDA|nr:DivIVA domain-containing protein [Streptomyces sp. ME19-01-6]
MSKPSDFRGFDVAWRGYDRQQVDRYLKALSEADSPVGPPPFQIVRRGYDRQQVDVRIRDLLADRNISNT